MRREQICFTCEGAWTPDHKHNVKGDKEANEIAKIEAEKEMARNASPLIVESVEGSMVGQESTIDESIGFHEETLGRHEQSYRDFNSNPDVHPCLMDECDKKQIVPICEED